MKQKLNGLITLSHIPKNEGHPFKHKVEVKGNGLKHKIEA